MWLQTSWQGTCQTYNPSIMSLKVWAVTLPVMPLQFHVIFHSTVQSYSLLISSLVEGMKLMSRAVVDYQGTTDQRIWKTLTLAEWTEAIGKYKADVELRHYNEFSPMSTHYIASYH